MNVRRIQVSLILCASLLAAAPALAHITLERQEARVGAPYKAVFRVPHGCGNAATLRIRIRIPEGVVAVKPMPKPGWEVELVRGSYAKAYKIFHNITVTEGVKEVIWRGRLPDEHYDEFVLAMYLTDDLAPGRMLYFPAVQECESGVHRWIEIPEEGKSRHEYKEPAPELKLLPKS
jgi:uncharacterized protein YcnI